jgi:hypothetical protein
MHRFFYQLVVGFQSIRAFFQQTQSLHTARFARLHELAPLITPHLDETSLLLGVAHFNQMLTVRPTKTRGELGNLLVVAPTRGGKGLAAVSQLLT